MAQFKGQYDFLFTLVGGSLFDYARLSKAQHMTIRQEIATEIANTIYLAQLQGWTPATIIADADGHKEESVIQSDLEGLISGLGRGANRLSIRPSATLAPVALGYDKQADCGISCHHVYTLHISRNYGSTYAPWTFAPPSFPQFVFQMRVSMMWISPSGVTSAVAASAPMTVLSTTEVVAPSSPERAGFFRQKTLPRVAPPVDALRREQAKRTGQASRRGKKRTRKGKSARSRRQV